MKKQIALFLAILMACSLFACGKSEAQKAFEKPENYATVLSVEINPTFNLYLDEAGTVLAVEAANDDAKAMQAKVDVIGKAYDVAVGEIVKTADAEGYLKDNAEVKITVVEAKNAAVSAQYIENANTAAAAAAQELGKTITLSTAATEATEATSATEATTAPTEAKKETTQKKETTSKETTKKSNVVTQDTYRYNGTFIREGNDNIVSLYYVNIQIYTKGGNFYINDEGKEVKDPCIQLLPIMDARLIPQDVSSAPQKIKDAKESLLKDYSDFGIAPAGLTWEQIFSDTYFKTFGGVTYKNVKYVPELIGGVGGENPLFKYTVSGNNVTLTDNISSCTPDFDITGFQWATDHKTITANITYKGTAEKVTLNLK